MIDYQPLKNFYENKSAAAFQHVTIIFWKFKTLIK
jgi:hypothetical protein